MTGQGSYKVRSALIAVEEATTQEIVQKLLAQRGIGNVSTQSGGHAAWRAAMTFPYDLIIMGWRFSGLSGLALFNRLRQTPQYQSTPILVVSKELQAEEFALLAEFPCSRLLNESLTSKYFDSGYDKVVDEANWYLVNAAMIENLIDFAERDATKALALLKGPLAKAPNPAPLAILIARKLRESGYLAEAERLLRDHLAKHTPTPVAYAELGKVLHLARRYPEAAKVLNDANAASPKNIARLCLLGDIDLTLANPTGALSRFARVLEIDVDSVAGKVGVKMITTGKGVAGSASATRSLVGMINIAAIVRIRKQRFEEGIETYNAALNLATDREAQMKLCFNLGLGFFKWGQNDKTLAWLTRALELGDGNYEKAALLKKHVESGSETLLGGDILDEELSLDFTIDDELTVELTASEEDFEDEHIG